MIYIFFICCLFIPEGLKGSSFSYLYWILMVGKYLGSIYFITEYISKFKISIVFKFFVCFHLTILISSFLNGSDLSIYRTWINATIPSLAAIAMIEIKCQAKSFMALDKIYYALLFLVVVNLIFMLFFPDGISFVETQGSSSTYREVGTHFLSVKNRLILWFLLLLLFNFLYNLRKFDSFYAKKDIIIYSIILLQLLYVESTTSILAILFFILSPVLYYWKQIRRAVSTFNFFLAYVSIMFFLIFFSHNSSFYEEFVTETLGKNIYMSGRTYIWDISLLKIMASPILGYGNAGNGNIIEWNGYLWYAHNLFLDILIQGGGIALLFFLCVIFSLFKKRKIDNKELFISTLSIGVIFILGISESFLNYPQLYICMSLNYYLKISKKES